jgi:signal transduction histidine kinase
MRSFISGSDQRGEGSSYAAFFAVVIIGYGMALLGMIFDSGWEASAWKIGVSVVLGLIYMYWGVKSDVLFDRFPTRLGTAVLFIIPIALVLVVQALLGANGTWLLSLPIVATAVERLPPVWRWPVYLASLLGLALPLWLLTGSINEIIGPTLVFIPAILFVVAFTEARLNERDARREAEKLTVELEKANHQLTAYAVQAEEMATIQERNRLAREIHDNVGHYLTVVNVQIEAARAVMAQDPDRARTALDKAQKLTKDGLTAVRQSVAAFRESPTDSRSLIDAIQSLVQETRSSGLVAEFEVVGEHRSLDSQTKLTLFRVAQEGLTNVRKHAHASRVDVVLDYSLPQTIRLSIRDNGVGKSAAVVDGFGLIGMRERVHMLGGRLTIESAVGKGLWLETAVPG